MGLVLLLFCLWRVMRFYMPRWLGMQGPVQRGWRRTEPCTLIRRKPAKPPWVGREIIRLKALMPDAGCRLIAITFNRRHAQHADINQRITVGKSYVAEMVRSHLCEIADLRRVLKHRVPSPLPRQLIWAMDLTGKGDAQGCVHAILGVIDHGTRALLCLKALGDMSSWTLLGHLFLTIGKYGEPKAIRTDNGSVFVSRVFRLVLKLVGIKHQRTEPSCPWQNGRIERLFGTLKSKLDRIEIDGLKALSSLLGEFGLWYNHVRPHQHLQGCTPAEAWAGVDPFGAPVKQACWFEAWNGLLCGFYLRR